MLFEWDEAKRSTNLDKHGLDFVDAALLLTGSTIVGEATTVAGELRMLATGRVGELFVTVVYTLRGDAVRIISMRRARIGERRQHEALHGR